LSQKEKKLHLLLLPFFLSAIIIIAFLLITVMLVKTQLVELSFVLLVIAGVYWEKMIKEITLLIAPYWSKKNVRNSIIAFCFIILGIGIYAGLSAIKAKEHLLRDVRDVRNNANDAIKWMGKNLRVNSTVAVTAPSLYGLGAEDEMTSKNDEYKLYAQYTFLQGYTRSYFRALSRDDLSLAYLEDSVKLSQILDAFRKQKNSYLFLQTGLDADRFHTIINGEKQLRSNDSLLMKFMKGDFSSEVWKLGK
jgi:hypothetical protein